MKKSEIKKLLSQYDCSDIDPKEAFNKLEGKIEFKEEKKISFKKRPFIAFASIICLMLIGSIGFNVVQYLFLNRPVENIQHNTVMVDTNEYIEAAKVYLNEVCDSYEILPDQTSFIDSIYVINLYKGYSFNDDGEFTLSYYYQIYSFLDGTSNLEFHFFQEDNLIYSLFGSEEKQIMGNLNNAIPLLKEGLLLIKVYEYDYLIKQISFIL